MRIESRMRGRGTAGLALVVGLVAGAPGTAAAQNGAKRFQACYVPEIGALYLIGEAGLPPTCLSATHEQISWTESGDGTVTIVDGSITTEKLADEAVTTKKIAASSVGSDQLSDGSVGRTKLTNNAVGTQQVQDGAVTADKLGVNAVTAAKIASGAVGSAELQNGAVGANQLGSNAVTSAKIANGAVTSTKLAGAAVGTDALADRSVTTVKIGKGAVTDFELAGNSVGRSAIQNDAVDGSKLNVNYSIAVSLAQEVAAGDTERISVTCPSGTNVVGGGYSTSPKRGTATAEFPDLGIRWVVDIWNDFAGGLQAVVYAICMDIQ